VRRAIGLALALLCFANARCAVCIEIEIRTVFTYCKKARQAHILEVQMDIERQA